MLTDLPDLALQAGRAGWAARSRVTGVLDHLPSPAPQALRALYRWGGLEALARLAGRASDESTRSSESDRAATPSRRPRTSAHWRGLIPPQPVTGSDPESEVKAMIAGGIRIDQVEDYIEKLALDDERRSALWLLAWAQATNPAVRRGQVATPPPVG